jgi:hypothetical protein
MYKKPVQVAPAAEENGPKPLAEAIVEKTSRFDMNNNV